MKAAAAYIIQADESTQKSLAVLMPHMLEVIIFFLERGKKVTDMYGGLAFITYYCCS